MKKRSIAALGLLGATALVSSIPANAAPSFMSCFFFGSCGVSPKAPSPPGAPSQPPLPTPAPTPTPTITIG